MTDTQADSPEADRLSEPGLSPVTAHWQLPYSHKIRPWTGVPSTEVCWRLFRFMPFGRACFTFDGRGWAQVEAADLRNERGASQPLAGFSLVAGVGRGRSTCAGKREGAAASGRAGCRGTSAGS